MSFWRRIIGQSRRRRRESRRPPGPTIVGLVAARA